MFTFQKPAYFYTNNHHYHLMPAPQQTVIHLLITAKFFRVHASISLKSNNEQISGKLKYCVSKGYCTKHIVHFLIQ